MIWIAIVEFVNKVGAVKMGKWFPRVVFGRVPFPADSVLKLSTEPAGSENGVHFKFVMIVNFDRRRGWRDSIRKGVGNSWFKKTDVEHRVESVEFVWEGKAEGNWTDDLGDREWAKTLRRELRNGAAELDMLGR